MPEGARCANRQGTPHASTGTAGALGGDQRQTPLSGNPPAWLALPKTALQEGTPRTAVAHESHSCWV
ncbi:hypothetical protein DP113_03445 [Brasilonema octagenarum UFV-E1]|uniref:Uncharacterized protein n=2 Tax=Brasilonema TaxID=383614 RepID=A0A856M7I4_9CYAN|nr:hypothetical protein [Brasilonema octagenarum UFV-OR1]QDL07093.1 hypothetical protein DP114_03490 [Brasilonema sennae CENA114]QDL13458.1 hypothetical protein DP113_03445 [Brasilonema octagenarum UFV-E1]